MTLLFVLLTALLVGAEAASARAAELEICHERSGGESDCYRTSEGAAVVETSGPGDEQPELCLSAKDSKRRVAESLIREAFEGVRALAPAERQLATPKAPAAILCDAYSLRNGDELVWSCIETQGASAHRIMKVMKQLEALCR